MIQMMPIIIISLKCMEKGDKQLLQIIKYLKRCCVLFSRELNLIHTYELLSAYELKFLFVLHSNKSLEIFISSWKFFFNEIYFSKYDMNSRAVKSTIWVNIHTVWIKEKFVGKKFFKWKLTNFNLHSFYFIFFN